MNLRTLASARLIGTKAFDFHSPELNASLAKKIQGYTGIGSKWHCQTKAMTSVSNVSNKNVAIESPEKTIDTGYLWITKDEPPGSPGLQAA